VIALCIGFVTSLVIHASVDVTPEVICVTAALSGALCVIASPRLRTFAVPALCGVALFWIRAPTRPPAWEIVPAPRLCIVSFEGVVARSYGHDTRGVQVALENGPTLRLPGWFSPPLNGSRVCGLGRLEPDGRSLRISDPDGIRVLHAPPWWHPTPLNDRARRWTRDRLRTALHGEAADIAVALVLGDPLPRETRDRYARTGTLHFFAVSGLHLALLASMIARFAGPRGRWVLPPLILYAAISGFRTPVQRALVMAGCVLGARAVGRPIRPLQHLCLAAVVVLSLRPAALTEAGFLLSFSAYGGILLLALPMISRRRTDPLRPLELAVRGRGPWRDRALDLWWVSCAAFLTSLPVTVLMFNRATPGALLASVLLSPLIPTLLIGSLCVLACPSMTPVNWLLEQCAAVLRLAVDSLDRLPGCGVDVARPHGAAVALYCLLLSHAVRRVRRGRSSRLSWCGVAAAACAMMIPCPAERGFELLPAGRGSALLATTPESARLIDAGPRGARIADRLLGRGIRELEALFITHDHEDHNGGEDRIRERLVVGGRPPNTGERLWPDQDVTGLGSNDRSMVLRLQGRRHRVLSTGDLETRGLRAWLQQADHVDSDILVLPHHGGRNDALGDLILRTAPDRVWRSGSPGSAHTSALLTVLWSGARSEATWSTRGCRARDRGAP